MKKTITLLLAAVMLLSLSACSAGDLSAETPPAETPTVVRTYERTPLEQSVITDLETVSSEDDLQQLERRIILRTYDEMSDGSWRAEGYTYKYRLEISGTMPNAEGNSTFVYLSNLESITFEQAWRAAGLSSNTADYFSRDEAVLVELISN